MTKKELRKTSAKLGLELKNLEFEYLWYMTGFSVKENISIKIGMFMAV